MSQTTSNPLDVKQPMIAEGYVIHNRKSPKPHRFKYNMTWFLLDLGKIDRFSKKQRLFGYNRWRLLSIYDKDYITKEPKSIKEKLSTYIQAKTNRRFRGDVLLFTHPKFLGYGFNSVNFYFCYEQGTLVYIVSEINNTPWGEKHLYLHDCLSQINQQKTDGSGHYVFEFEKAFHISPFVAMDMHYCWDFKIKKNQLLVKMSVDKDNVNVLNVILDTNITPLMDNEFWKLVLKKPFQPWKMALGIYWQAFKIWLKKIPVHDHPANKTNQ